MINKNDCENLITYVEIKQSESITLTCRFVIRFRFLLKVFLAG